MRHTIQAAFVLLCLVGFAPGTASVARAEDASKRASIDSGVDSALSNLYASVPGAQGVVSRATGVLVFPEITKAGFIIGGSGGEGALRVGGRSIGYYRTGGLSFGLQAGAERHSMALVFMTPQALQNFQNSNGWDVGGDASVAIVQTGAGGKVDATQLTKPVQVFVYGNKGLMGSLSLEGTKITREDL
jgi:lipid-binding SYLF domain-containing protein